MIEGNIENHVGEEKTPEEANENRESLQFRLANERNTLRWVHQKEYENLQINENDEDRDALQRRNSIYQAIKMTKILLNLQDTLYCGRNQDTKKAVEYLNEISQQLFTPASLIYAPLVVRYVYSLCVYKHSEEVRMAARRCYRKFAPCFGVNVLRGETFESTFEAHVRKFWETQDHISYDATKYNWKTFEMKVPGSLNGEVNEVEDDDVKIIKCEQMDVDKRETDEKTLIKKELQIEVKNEVLDENIIVKKELCFEVDDEDVDDKSLVKKEIMELEGIQSSSSGNFLLPGGIKIKEEKPDSDIEDCCIDTASNYVESNSTFPSVKVKTEKYNLPELRVNIEPIDLEKLNAEYNSEDDCFVLGW